MTLCCLVDQEQRKKVNSEKTGRVEQTLGKTTVRKHLENVPTTFGFVYVWSQGRAAFLSLNL